MYWEWNWPHKLNTIYATNLVDVNIRFEKQGDHSPGIHCYFGIAGYTLIDCGYYNSYHQKDDELKIEFRQ